MNMCIFYIKTIFSGQGFTTIYFIFPCYQYFFYMLNIFIFLSQDLFNLKLALLSFSYQKYFSSLTCYSSFLCQNAGAKYNEICIFHFVNKLLLSFILY